MSNGVVELIEHSSYPARRFDIRIHVPKSSIGLSVLMIGVTLTTTSVGFITLCSRLCSQTQWP